MATPGAASVDPPLVGDRDIDLRYYIGLVLRHRAFLAACAAVGLLIGLVFALVQTPEYRAAVTLQIEPPPPAFASVSDALLVGSGNYWQNTDFYNTQFRVLRSGPLGKKVVAKLKLTDREPFKSSIDPAVLFMSYVGVEPIPESRLVLVTVTHRDAREAALWANTLGDVYIEQSLATRVESARRAMEWLQERLVATQQGMRDAQDRLFQSYRTQDLFVPEGSVTAVSSSIAKLQEDFVQAQARRITIEAALKQATDMRRRHEELDALPQVAADPRGHGLQLADREPVGRARPARGEVPRGPPRGAEGEGAARAAQEGPPGARRPDPRRAGGRSTRSSRSARRSCGARSTSRSRRRPARAASRPSSRRSRRRPNRRRASTRCCCRSSTRRTSRPRSAAPTSA